MAQRSDESVYLFGPSDSSCRPEPQGALCFLPPHNLTHHWKQRPACGGAYSRSNRVNPPVQQPIHRLSGKFLLSFVGAHTICRVVLRQKQQRCTSAPGFHPDWVHRFRRRRLRFRRCRRRIRPTRTIPKEELCSLGISCQNVSPWDRLCPGVCSTTQKECGRGFFSRSPRFRTGCAWVGPCWLDEAGYGLLRFDSWERLVLGSGSSTLTPSPMAGARSQTCELRNSEFAPDLATITAT